MENLILTKLEKELIEIINKVDTPEYINVSDILDNCYDMTIKVARGVLGSLTKKMIIDIDDDIISIFEESFFNFENK